MVKRTDGNDPQAAGRRFARYATAIGNVIGKSGTALILGLSLFCCSTPVLAATAAPHIDGAALGLVWGLPFVGILLSIALTPLIAPGFWHRHFGKVSAFWALALLVPFTVAFGPEIAAYELLHALLKEYVPFILLLLALFVVAGGIRVVGNLRGTPTTNTALLAFGTMIASLVGTTGATMLLIRPLIQANQNRRRKIHIFVFFIFLVANIGGSLTPLGDPPLFLGFLQGVDFIWTLRFMSAPMFLCSAILLVLFYGIDYWAVRGDKAGAGGRGWPQVRLQGRRNLILLVGVVVAVLLSGVWQPDVSITVFHVPLPLAGVVRDLILLFLAWLSWRTTPRQLRIENAFTWEPIQEVAILFAGIFVTIIPPLAILKAGSNGALAELVGLVNGAGGQPNDAGYFWLTGLLSSFLDNAPTYLVFFNVAGGDSQALMGPLASTLLAISAGAVFFGALTYIGNAPNFIVKSICEERGIRMPSFFGYIVWSGAILLPLFALVTLIFFRM
jgi:Na+/H+ antiporter NhaD/arsenite permease-like protein